MRLLKVKKIKIGRIGFRRAGIRKDLLLAALVGFSLCTLAVSAFHLAMIPPSTGNIPIVLTFANLALTVAVFTMMLMITSGYFAMLERLKQPPQPAVTPPEAEKQTPPETQPATPNAAEPPAEPEKPAKTAEPASITPVYAQKPQEAAEEPLEEEPTEEKPSLESRLQGESIRHVVEDVLSLKEEVLKFRNRLKSRQEA